MIRPEQIPDEVVEAAIYGFYNATGPKTKDDWRSAIAAAMNAWPSGAVCHYRMVDSEGLEMVLPLPFPQEK